MQAVVDAGGSSVFVVPLSEVAFSGLHVCKQDASETQQRKNLRFSIQSFFSLSDGDGLVVDSSLENVALMKNSRGGVSTLMNEIKNKKRGIFFKIKKLSMPK